MLLQSIGINAQNTQTGFKLVSWNMEWFGSSTNGPADLNLQKNNAIKVLRYVNADVMGLVEVVDTARFHQLVDSLGPDYGYKIADYCSNNTTGAGSSWLTGQKQAFVYKKSVVTNVSFRGFMRSSSTASSNWASGRFPFLMNADVVLNGVTKNINFFVIHGKAETTPCASSNYTKKYNAAQEMKDSLDAEYPHALNVIVGDYNDDLYKTINTCAGTTVSAYSPIISDSAHYMGLTISLSKAGDSSMIDYAGVIDNHIVSAGLDSLYVPNSIHIANEVRNFIANYTTDNTSDHYPVYSVYSYTQQNSGGVVTAVPVVTPANFNVSFYPNPTHDVVYLHFGEAMQTVNIQLFDVAANPLWSQTYSHVVSGQVISLPLANLASGIHIVKISNTAKQTVLKLLKQ